MSEIERLQQQVDQSYNGPAWHGPSLRQNLEGITAEMAAQYPIEGAHSIWELVQHMTAWMTEVIRVIDGEEYVMLEGEQDWGPIAVTDDGAWASALAILDSTEEAFAGALGDLKEEQLDENVPGAEFTYYYLLHGVVQHSAYHTGQIGLLRKLVMPPVA